MKSQISLGVVACLVVASCASVPKSISVDFNLFCDEIIGCNFRAMGQVGGELMLLDTGSSTTAFCLPPVEGYVKNAKNLEIDGMQVSQCKHYGGLEGGHGFWGPTSSGDIRVGSKQQGFVMRNSTFTTMQATVGLGGNSCGEPSLGSRGVAAPLGGILGLAFKPNNEYQNLTAQDEVSATWNITGTGCYRSKGECLCAPDKGELPANFQAHIEKRNPPKWTQWSLSWDGTLGPKSGSIQIGKRARTPGVPKAKLVSNAPGLGDRYYVFNITQVGVNNQSLGEVGACIFDTGTPMSTLPASFINMLTSKLSATQPTTVEWVLEGMPGKEDVTITWDFPALGSNLDSVKAMFKDMINDDGGPCMWGLDTYRFFETVTMNFGQPADSYFQFAPRASSILTSYEELPLSQHKSDF